MQTKSDAGTQPWTDAEDAPELTEAFFREADIHDGPTVVRRGRPRLERPKRQVTLRLDGDVIDRYRATGPGWQVRMNEALRAELDRTGAGTRMEAKGDQVGRYTETTTVRETGRKGEKLRKIAASSS